MTLGSQIWEALSEGNIETVVELYNTALSGVPYDNFPNRNEFGYRSLFLILLRGAGIISYADILTSYTQHFWLLLCPFVSYLCFQVILYVKFLS